MRIVVVYESSYARVAGPALISGRASGGISRQLASR
jgi:hypothetical protein